MRGSRKVIWRLGLLVGACAAMLAVGGVGATGAIACPISPSHAIAGEGAAVQGVAQGIWSTAYAPCQTVTYTANSSPQGMQAFGFQSEKLQHEFQFIGTDYAPNELQIEHAKTVASGAVPVIVPVTQTSIAVVVHPPSGCTLKKISWADLNKVFGGNAIKKWNEFGTATGGASCESPVTRVVRTEGSGVTYQFKNYLATVASQVGGENLPCTVAGSTKWIELREVGIEEKPNRTWPECTGGTAVVRAAGDGAVAAKVVATAGTIGYASLPNAEAQGATVVSLQSGLNTGVPIYGSPVAGTSSANCSGTVYRVPTAAQSGTPGSDWSEVFGAYPQIGGSFYPLCTLTYDIGWHGYATAGYTSLSTAYAHTVEDYLRNYVLSTSPGGGQPAVANHWYAALPTGMPPFNVQTAAELSAEQIN
jgi:ABC-type phosphate transport system substrate-binding protein